eukprot:scaffold91867_cov30-Tisochrysis_lutea.AAC.1
MEVRNDQRKSRHHVGYLPSYWWTETCLSLQFLRNRFYLAHPRDCARPKGRSCDGHSRNGNLHL